MYGLKVAAVFFAAALTAGGAFAQAPTKIDFQLNWKISGDHAPTTWPWKKDGSSRKGSTLMS